MYINFEKFQQIELLRDGTKQFLFWICPKLELFRYDSGSYIFKEGDEFDSIYFMIKGTASFVLEEYDNFEYIKVSNGSTFGVIDISLDSMYKEI